MARRLSAGGAACAVCPLILALSLPCAIAAPIQPTGIVVSIPVGSNDTTNPYTDDVILDQLIFGGVRYRRIDNAIRAVSAATVYFNRSGVNAEFGDNDNGSDGNPNPFVAAGLIAEGQALSDAMRESTSPWIQDPSIRAAFSSFSISSGVDGEGPDYAIDLIFTQGVIDNRPNRLDNTPELTFFERGMNSSFGIQVILGGTLQNPILSDRFDVIYTSLWDSGIDIDTIEIGSPQRLGAVGIDLNEFRVGGVPIGNAPVFGVRITSINNTGADMYGIFAVSNDPNRFVDLPPGLQGVPEPGSSTLLAAGLSLLAVARRRTSTRA